MSLKFPKPLPIFPKLIANAFSATLVLVCSIVPAASQAADVSTELDKLVQATADGKTFMGSVLVVKDGKPLLDKAYGYANLEWMQPNTTDTKFRLGSVTKQFTAAAILLLEERGKLKLDDPVKTYVTNAPAAWDKVTIFHLLTHTAGIPNFTGFPDYASTQTVPATPEQLVARFRDKPLEFQPGEKWNYSNSGYALLGYVIEKASGQSYAEFLQQNIFTPLAMKDTGYDNHSMILAKRASGYTPDKDGPKNADYIDMSIPYAAGALYSTTGDLLRWEQGLFGGKLLSAASLKKMTTAVKNGYAMGVGATPSYGHRLFDHGGGIDGFNTHLSYYPDDKLVVVVLANLNGHAADELSNLLGKMAIDGKVTLTSDRKEIAVPTNILSTYVGNYALTPTFNITITLEGKQLSAQGTNQPKLPLFAETTSDFFLKATDVQMSFVKDASGKVSHLVLHQGGRDQEAKKVE